MASGTIIAQTRTGDAYLPVENVTVAFYEPGERGMQHLLALRKSDSSGKTAPVVLETPALSESQQPEEAGEPAPYRVVDIAADHPGYEPIEVKGVQIFDGIVTFQDLMLVPLQDSSPDDSPEETFDTSSQDL